MFDALEKAWNWRKEGGVFEETDAVRVFHGPGEGEGGLKSFAVERFGDYFWIIFWGNSTQVRDQEVLKNFIQFYSSKGAKSIVGLTRPKEDVAAEVQIYSGEPKAGRFEVREKGLRFWIQFEKTRHPGLFLDHEPLRSWLVRQAHGMRVLNTFSYTGSLSVAAAAGGAKHVTTLDLSKPVIEWAKDNFVLNGFEEDRGRFIAGDVFEWLPKFKRSGEKFDCVILDPPSFSRGNKGNFSTSKDLERLHSLAMGLLSDTGILVTSINSVNVSWQKYESEVLKAARSLKMNFNVLKQIDLPETFPTRLGFQDQRYLKGWILKR